MRVLLAEDHAVVREAIAVYFEREAGFKVVGQAASLEQARNILGERPVDVAVIDLGLPDGYGGAQTRNFERSTPRTQALVLSAHIDREQVARAVESGAAGVLHKTVHPDELVDAMRRLGAWHPLMPLEEVVELLRFANSSRDQEYAAGQAVGKLTPREREVLEAPAEGLDGNGISRRLSISNTTERNYMSSAPLPSWGCTRG